MRPLSAPKHSVRRVASGKPRPRVQSGKVKQIKQFLSEQEAAHIALQQQIAMEQAQMQQEQHLPQEADGDDAQQQQQTMDEQIELNEADED